MPPEALRSSPSAASATASRPSHLALSQPYRLNTLEDRPRPWHINASHAMCYRRFTCDFTVVAARGEIVNGRIQPFGNESIAEIPLPGSPLAEVLAQVRFPPIVSLSRQEFLASFQEDVRSEYPILSEERQLGIFISPQGMSAVPQQDGGILWRLTDLPKVWRLTVAPNFIALETKQYTNRADFLDRLQRALAAFEQHIKPNLYDRIGVRYINRVADGKWLDDLNLLVRPDVLGLLDPMDAGPGVRSLRGQLTVEYQLDASVLLVRSARVPPGETHDPTLEPVSTECWLLDLDMSTTPKTPLPFVAEEITNTARSFAEAIYRYFRWSVTDEFLRRAGGK